MKPILHQAIYIQFVHSTLMLGLLCFVSIVCCLILIALPLGTPIKIVTILLVLVSTAYFILRDALLLLPWSWKSLEINNKGELSMISKRGQQLKPMLADSTFIHRKLTILNFKRESFKLALPSAIFFENSDEVRRLRVWLRWSKCQQLSQEDLTAVND
jgi:hypothetical protein